MTPAALRTAMVQWLRDRAAQNRLLQARAERLGHTSLAVRHGEVAEHLEDAARDGAGAVLQAIDAAGWQVVPKEPTEDMGVAGARTMPCDAEPGALARSFAGNAWAAMVAAAPRITEETTP